MLRGTGLVGVLTLLSRVLGFVRDLLVARLFGASPLADAFFVAFRIPNLLRSLVAEGALTSAFVPVFSQELATGKDRAQRTLNEVGGFLILVTTGFSILGIVFSDTIVSLMAPGFTAMPETFELCVLLTQIMFPYIVYVSLVVLLNGALNAVHVFGTSAVAQVYMNLVLIAGALGAEMFGARSASVALSVSVVIGGLVQVLTQVPALKRAGFTCIPSFRLNSPEIRQVVGLMLPATVGASIYQISVFINTLLASLLEPGAVSWLFYADRVAQFPLGVFSLALASVLLPTLSRARASKNREEFTRSLSDALRYTSFLIIPTAVGLWVLAEPITALLFQRGAFTPEATARTAAAMRMLSIGLWATSCHSMVVRAFIAEKDTVTPTVIGGISVFTGVLLSSFLMGPMAAAPRDLFGRSIRDMQAAFFSIHPGPGLGHAGLSLASSTTAYLSFILAVIILRRRGVAIGGKGVTLATLRAVAASAVLAAVLAAVARSFDSPLVITIVSVPAGALSYGLSSILLRSPEARETLSLARRLSARVLKRA